MEIATLKEERMDARPWQPKPFSIAVLDSDEYLAEVLCGLLRDSGFAATVFYDLPSLMRTQQSDAFDAYVLDYLVDWQPQSKMLEEFVAAIRSRSGGDAPIFILGNQTAPEKNEKLHNLITRHKVRYLLKPVRAAYLAKRIAEALATRAGL